MSWRHVSSSWQRPAGARQGMAPAEESSVPMRVQRVVLALALAGLLLGECQPRTPDAKAAETCFTETGF